MLQTKIVFTVLGENNFNEECSQYKKPLYSEKCSFIFTDDVILLS